jgi:hypothetical protein
MKVFIVLATLALSLIGIGFLFWTQELKYSLPTPIPSHYKNVLVNEKIDLYPLLARAKGVPLFLHFFNPDCPCSRFNLTHFKSLVRQHGANVQMVAVIPAYGDVERAKEMIDDNAIEIIHDTTNVLAEKCGVYSTPQAVLIDADQRLYFRGNYNKSRYCTTKESNFAALSLESLLRGEPAPMFGLPAIQAYGCELPDTTDNPTFSLIP